MYDRLQLTNMLRSEVERIPETGLPLEVFPARIQKKTKIDYELPLLDIPLRILDKYRGIAPEGKLLPSRRPLHTAVDSYRSERSGGTHPALSQSAS